MYSLVLLSGFITLTLSVSRQYVFVNESKTWAEAQRYCRVKYTDLATIENEQQTIQLLDTVNDDSIDLAWIGLYDDLNRWNWTLQDSNFFKAGEKDFRNWNNPVPYNYGAQSQCVYMYMGIWHAAYCTGSYYPVVCYDGRENASSAYVFIPQSQTWTEAQSYCREHYTDLASIRNETENQIIESITTYNGYAWIGLYKTRSWSDQSNSSFNYWSLWQPSSVGSCTVVSFSDSGKWMDKDCGYAFPFICYSELGSIRQYNFVSVPMTWTDAQSFCRKNYTDLATLDNMEEMNRLIDTVNGSYSGLAWIGQYDDVNSWKWSLEDNDFYQQGEKDYRNFYHEPNNSGGKELCVYMDGYGKWFDSSCYYSLQFICYDGRQNATQKYIRITDSRNWTEAYRYCRNHYTDLVNIRNESENQKILETAGGGVWIGLYRNRTWSDQQITSYENWRPEILDSGLQPDNGEDYAENSLPETGHQHCTAVSFGDSGRWTDEVCVSRMPFFCYNRNCTQSTCTRQYHLVSDPKTWTEAQSFCRQNYTDLATIDNMDEMKMLFKTVRGTFYGKAWIGLYDDLDSWRWSLNNTPLQGGYKNWYVLQPLNWGGQSLCVYLSAYRGKWRELSCSQMYRFVCYDGRVNASSSYVLVNQYKSWTDAQSYCREHHTDLVSIRNEIENYRVQSVITNYYVVWIGLYRSRSWSDQSNSSFSNWRPGQPDNAGNSEYCTAVSFSDSGSWTDENCNTAFPFICYSASSRQYYFVSESMNWTEAQRFCRQSYTDLATIDNMEEMNRLINTVNGSYNGSAWIGLYDDVNSWRWSLEDNDFYKEGEKDYRNWYHEPNNLGGKELCVYMQHSGSWLDTPCDNSYPFVCYNEHTQKYILVTERNTWTSAQSYCRNISTDLASVRSETELQQILSITVSGNFGYDVWIGLYRNRLWSDQSNSSFSYWLPRTQRSDPQPDNGLSIPGQSQAQHCTTVSLKYFGRWTDERCFNSLPFFCYSEHQLTFLNEYVVGLRVKVSTLENLSQIEQKVIIRLQEELIKHGVSSNFTMSPRDLQKIKP